MITTHKSDSVDNLVVNIHVQRLNKIFKTKHTDFSLFHQLCDARYAKLVFIILNNGRSKSSPSYASLKL